MDRMIKELSREQNEGKFLTTKIGPDEVLKAAKRLNIFEKKFTLLLLSLMCQEYFDQSSIVITGDEKDENIFYLNEHKDDSLEVIFTIDVAGIINDKIKEAFKYYGYEGAGE